MAGMSDEGLSELLGFELSGQGAEPPEWKPSLAELEKIVDSAMYISANAEVYVCEHCATIIVDDGDRPDAGFCGSCRKPVCPRCADSGAAIQCPRCAEAFCQPCGSAALLVCDGKPAHARCLQCAEEEKNASPPVCPDCDEVLGRAAKQRSSGRARDRGRIAP